MSIGSLEVMEMLNDPTQFGKHLSLQTKLSRYIQEGSVGKVRTLMSGYGKSKQGFDNLDPELKDRAIKLLQANGFVPLVDKYRTIEFTVFRIQPKEAIPKK